LELLKFLFEKAPLTIQYDLYPSINIKTEQPLELGTDLFLNAVAAHTLFHRNNIIIDFGTALTFTVVEKTGNLLGVAIAPGLRTAIKALYKVTAQLPQVPLEWPKSTIGKNTEEAIQSGVLIGYIGLVKFHVEKIKEEFGQDFTPIITGGFSSIVQPLQSMYKDIDPMLTLKGMEIYSRFVFSQQKPDLPNII
jgi:type III pantothenate kinase